MHFAHDILEAFASGRLPAAEAERVEAHLLECADCVGMLDEIDLSGDHLIGLLRGRRDSVRGGDTPEALAQTIDGSDPQAVTAPEPIRRPAPEFGRYRIEEELGRGGMGVVYKAYDANLRRTVALKIIATDRVKRREDRARFRQEAESAARLQHANIVQIFDFGEHDGQLFCEFELVEGGSLAQRLEAGTLAEGEAAKMIATLADAVEYAHERKVIHRDLKPENVLLTSNGTPKIADFGLAKRLDENVSQTVVGTLMGSPCYMAPEQASANPNSTPATDIYGLGTILYEALVGKPPFREADMWATLEQVKYAVPEPPRRSRGDLDRDLETVCLKCLEKQPARRYARPADLAADLRRFLDGRPVSARRAGRLARSVKLAKRHPAAACFSALFVLLVLAFVTIVTRLYIQRGEALTEVRETSRSLRRSNFALQLKRAADLAPTNPEQAIELLRDETLCPVELRDFSHRYLYSCCQREDASWKNGGEVRALAIAVNGDRFVTGDESGVVRVWSLESEEPARTIGDHRGPVTGIAFSPDGRFLATSGEDGTVRLYQWPELDCCRSLSARAGRANGLSYSPDSALLATGYSDGVVCVWPLPEAHDPVELPSHEGSVLRVCFSPDGRYLASGSLDGGLRVWDAHGDWCEFVELHQFGTDVKFQTPRSDVLVTANMYRNVQRCTIEADGRLVPDVTLLRFGEKVAEIDFSPDGAHLAAASYDGTIQIRNVETGESIVLQRETEFSAVAFLSPEKLLTGSKAGCIQCWNLQPKAQTIEIRAHAGRSVTALAFWDRQSLVSGGSDGSVRIWNVEDGSPLAQLHAPRGLESVTDLAIAGNRSRLVWEVGGEVYRGHLGESTWQAQKLPMETLLPSAMSISRTGDLMMVVDSAGVTFYSTFDGKKRWTWSDSEVHCLAASPIDDRVAAGSENGDVWILDPVKQEARGVAALTSSVRSLAISPDGVSLAVGTGRGEGVIYDLSTGNMTATMQGHARGIACLAFSPDGKTLVTGSAGDVRLWDAVTSAERLTLKTRDSIVALSFAPDSRALAIGGSNGTIQIWKGD